MRYASVTDRLAGLGGEKWAIHQRSRDRMAAGEDIIELTIGEPDVPPPADLIAATTQAMRAGRTNYSNGRGEPALCRALADRYSRSSGRAIGEDQVLCFPGTQTALYAVITGLAETGDEVLVGDPMYATYEGVVAAGGARVAPVPLRPEHGFRLQAGDLAARITPASRAVLINSPHNPTGAVLTPQDIAGIGAVAKEHDLWLVVDEVYEELVFGDTAFHSPLADPDLADRVVVTSSISKSHAAPGFRSGWCIGPKDLTERLLPLSETMLFGNQPFIADMTAAAVAAPSPVAPGMSRRFAARATRLAARLAVDGILKVHPPEAGMFAMVDVAATGLDGEAFAQGLLDEMDVAVMPGGSFGETVRTWVRIALTVDDTRFDTAIDRIAGFARAGTARRRA